MSERRWFRRVVACLVALDLLGATVVLVVHSRDSTTPVEVDAALDRFRVAQSTTTVPPQPGAPASAGSVGAAGPSSTAAASGGDVGASESVPSPSSRVPGDRAGARAPQQPPADPSARPRPPAGVYVYRTTGGESVDVMGGARHDYPDRTTITLVHTACGITTRWQPIEERWDEDDRCHRQAGIDSVGQRTHHEFYGVSDDQTFTCEPGNWLLPAAVEPGTTWKGRCRSGSTISEGASTVVGTERLTIGGQPVDVVHVRSSSEPTGDNRGTSRSDDWLRASDGLLVKREAFVETESDSQLGTTTYREQYTLVLESLQPRT